MGFQGLFVEPQTPLHVLRQLASTPDTALDVLADGTLAYLVDLLLHLRGLRVEQLADFHEKTGFDVRPEQRTPDEIATLALMCRLLQPLVCVYVKGTGELCPVDVLWGSHCRATVRVLRARCLFLQRR